MNAIATRFFSFVEIQTKPATIIPALVALAYVFYTTGRINVLSTLIYLVAALLLDMSVTAINNYFDKREEQQIPHFSKPVSLGIIFTMLLVFAVLGLYLAYLHGITVLLAGAFCLLVGVAYTFGPVPISKSPYGELASGFTAGTVLMFIVVSINNPAFRPLGLALDIHYLRLALDIDLVGLLSFVLITLPIVFCAANITLANNICDAEKDRPYRYTLPHSVGISNALRLYSGLYYGAYTAITLAVLLGILPVWCLATLATIVPIQKNINRFLDKQEKNTTFILSVRNFSLILLVFAISIVIGGLL